MSWKKSVKYPIRVGINTNASCANVSSRQSKYHAFVFQIALLKELEPALSSLSVCCQFPLCSAIDFHCMRTWCVVWERHCLSVMATVTKGGRVLWTVNWCSSMQITCKYWQAWRDYSLRLRHNLRLNAALLIEQQARRSLQCLVPALREPRLQQ